jgi:hypothetical protein
MFFEYCEVVIYAIFPIICVYNIGLYLGIRYIGQLSINN